MGEDNSGDSDKQIVDLEVRVAYQDKTIEQLDEVVRELADRVQRLEERIVELSANAADFPEDPSNDPPPHY